jgi:hypothetical protein
MRMLNQRCGFLALSFTAVILIPAMAQFAVGQKEIYHLKWSQPPIEINPRSNTPLYCGWDEPSLYSVSSTAAGPWKIVADDFRCLGSMPIASVHWWGSYNNWSAPTPPADKPDTWQIAFWSNEPADSNINFSRPGRLLWQVEVSHDRVSEEGVGFDLFPQKPFDSCFQYYVQFRPEEYFWQNQFIDVAETDPNSRIFWVSITAVYSAGGAGIPIWEWGWKTRPRHWMDNAVTFELVADEIQPGMIVDSALVIPITDSAVCDSPEGYDTAFELGTDPNYIKWEQPFTGIRNWPHYEDEESMALVDPEGVVQISRLVADDWKCEGNKPVTSVVWWGSYIGYNYQACECEQTDRPLKPDYFLLSIWTDVPDPDPNNPQDFGHPGQKVWEYRAPEYDEVLVGYDKHPETMLADGLELAALHLGYEPVFRYSVRLPQENWFCQESETTVYWLSVVAVYKDTQLINFSWGWTNHQQQRLFWLYADDNRDAVAGKQEIDATGAQTTWLWEELYDQVDESEDMSFVLFADVEDCNSTLPVTCRPACTTICPAIQTACPAVETQCPTTQTICPAVQTQCPSVSTQCPIVPTQCPTVDTQCPASTTKCPPVETQCPGGATNCPPIETQCPLVNTQCPAVGTQCPTIQTRCPGGETYCPPVETQCPVVSTQCPVTQTQCPVVNTQCPMGETRCPVAETKCPLEITRCPAGSTSCPPVETRCPVVSTRCPVTQTQCPVVNTQCPMGETRCPVAETKCPLETTRCPAGSTSCPPVETQCPVASTQCPPLETQCPVAETKCPLETTRCPAEQTQCPVIRTQCPTAITKCPPQVQTQCPVVYTHCPVVKTRCPGCDFSSDNSSEESVHFITVMSCPAIDVECPSVVPRSAHLANLMTDLSGSKAN